MATKRFAEYRLIGDPERAGFYRKSFKFYTESKLLISMFFYAITCAFFLGIFLIKHRIEMVVSFPFFALLFAWYLKIGLLKNSPVQGSEKLYTRKYFMMYLVLFTILFCVLMFKDIPALRWHVIDISCDEIRRFANEKFFAAVHRTGSDHQDAGEDRRAGHLF